MEAKKQTEEDLGAICHTCAISKGWKWPEGHCATHWNALCPYCKTNHGVCGTNDWLKPGQKKMRLEDWD